MNAGSKARGSLSRKSSTSNLFTQPSNQSNQHETTTDLAERVYSWSLNELDYRPESSDVKTRAHGRSVGNSRLNISQEREFTPESLQWLCNGPCAPIFEYLLESIKSRSTAQSSRMIDSSHDRIKDQADRENQFTEEIKSRTHQCRDLTLAIAQKQREIAQAKERIKKQRHLQTIKDIHRKQSLAKIRILQEYEALVQQLSTNLADNSLSTSDKATIHFAIKSALEKALEEIMNVTKLVAVDGKTLDQVKSFDLQGIQELHNKMRQDGTGVSYVMEMLKELKKERIQSIQTTTRSNAEDLEKLNTNSETTKLLQLFREHHIERVVQIESVLNKISACEREKSQLLSRMRFQAQRYEQIGKETPFFQELEETKAYLIGLGVALEFIQAEQENMVERVEPLEEQELKIEAMSKISRAVDQKMFHLQSTAKKLFEMIQINHQKIPQAANEISQEISHSISQDLSALSDLVHKQGNSFEGDSKVLQDLASQLKQPITIINKQDSWLAMTQTEDSQRQSKSSRGPSHTTSWQELSSTSLLSPDQYLLQLSESKRQLEIHRVSLSNAKEENMQIGQAKKHIVSLMNTFTQNLPKAKPDGNGELTLGALVSKFEADVEENAKCLEDYETRRHSELVNHIQQTNEELEFGEGIIQKMQDLIEDHNKIVEGLRNSEDSSPKPLSKKMRYAQ